VAEVGPGDWSVIESWLSQQLARPMAVPDLSAKGLSYEGARLIGDADGPPMAMLLYEDAEQRPVSLTIALDRRGEKPLTAGEAGGLNVIDWREERHAFFLAGESEASLLEAVGVELLNDPPRMSGDAPVPVSRYVRPGQRPRNAP
jgi:anti-sigma factor RsiW